MANQLEVANAALDLLGEPPITAIDAASTLSPHSRVIARQWPFALEELIRAFPWNWAKTRASLPLASPSPLFEWSYAFELPDDYITLLAINETSVGRPGDWWEIESGMLFTDDCGSGDSVFIEYIAKPTTSATDAYVERIDPLALNALVTLLASKIVTSIARDGGAKAAELRQQYLRMDLPQARLRAAGESKAPWGAVRTDSAFDQSRYGGPAG